MSSSNTTSENGIFPTTILREGVYSLSAASRGFREVLDLEAGNWKTGRLKTAIASPEAHSNSSRNQRFIITIVGNEQGDSYHIINLFYGCLVGIFTYQNSWIEDVKAGPSNTHESMTQWEFRRELAEGESTYSVYWKNENKYRFHRDVRRGKLTASKGSDGDHGTQTWRLDIDSTMTAPGNPRASWMEHIYDNPVLSMLNLVGTHQSLALHGKGRQGSEGIENPGGAITNVLDNPRCQNRSPYEQMLDGIRVFDCRFTVYGGNTWRPSLYAWHGANSKVIGAAMGYSATALFQSIKLFLQSFPSETIIVYIRDETKRAGFEQAFRNDFHGFEHLFFKNDRSNRQSIHQIHVDDVRGRAILVMAASSTLPFPQIFHADTFWSGIGAHLFEEGQYNLAKARFPDKIEACRGNIEKAKNDLDSTHVFRTFWNMSAALSYNPSHFFVYARPHIQSILSEEEIGRDGRHRIGVIYFDFVEQVADVVLNIIRSNEGCGGIAES